MTKTSAETESKPLKHDLLNSAARAAIIREIDAELAAKDQDIKKLQAERTSYKNRRIKGELGMKMSDFNLAVRIVGLEDVERDNTLDTIREVIAALKPGEQSSFLDAIQAKKTPIPGEPEKKRRGRPPKVKLEVVKDAEPAPIQDDSDELEVAVDKQLAETPDAPAPEVDETDDEKVTDPVGETEEEDFDPPDAAA